MKKSEKIFYEKFREIRGICEDPDPNDLKIDMIHTIAHDMVYTLENE